MKILPVAAALTALLSCGALADEYLGNLSSNPYHPNSTSNPYGAGTVSEEAHRAMGWLCGYPFS